MFQKSSKTVVCVCVLCRFVFTVKYLLCSFISKSRCVVVVISHVAHYWSCRLSHLSVDRSVCLSVCPESVLWKNGLLDPDSIWDGELGWLLR